MDPVSQAKDKACPPATDAGDGFGSTAWSIVLAAANDEDAGLFVASTPQHVNVSVLKHLGTSLTVGFVVGGAEALTAAPASSFAVIEALAQRREGAEKTRWSNLTRRDCSHPAWGEAWAALRWPGARSAAISYPAPNGSVIY